MIHEDACAILKTPLRLLQDEFASCLTVVTPKEAAAKAGLGDFKERAARLAREERVPWLFRKNQVHENHSLVRVRGMLQDMLDPEYFQSVIFHPQGPRLAKFREATFEEEVSAENLEMLSERLPVVCVPIPGENQWVRDRVARAEMLDRSCIVNFYDQNMKGRKLNQAMDVVGVLSVAEDEDGALPVVHCIVDLKEEDKEEELPQSCDFSACREKLLGILELQVFRNDRLTAEYALLWMMSSVSRAGIDEVLVGKFVLALSQHQDSSCSGALARLCEELLPRSMHFNLGTEFLNNSRLYPRKDYISNTLEVGQLQLCKQTATILDETELAPGVLSDTGVRNTRALTLLASEQKLCVDFEFFQHEVPVNLPLIVMTANKKPALVDGIDCTVPFKPTTEVTKEVLNIPDETKSQLRDYLQLVHSMKTPFRVVGDLTTEIENFYVAERKKRPNETGLESLDLWLTLAKLHSKSLGESELQHSTWNATLQREAERHLRRAYVA